MSIWQAILLGVIQGLTEFIPISSTAHLTLAGKVMGLVDPEHPEQWTAFIAVIQLGTLIAVCIFFFRDIVSITRSFIVANLARLRGRQVDPAAAGQARLGWLVIIGTLPIAIVGLLLKDIIEGSLTKSLSVIAGSLIGLALVLTLAELVGSRQRSMKDLNPLDAAIVGVAQVCALIPGSSRSGVTITGALFAGLTRETAARFSFLLSIPAVAASGLLELPTVVASVQGEITSALVATAVSAVFGYASIAFLLRYLQSHTTFLFVGYRLVLGLVLIALLVAGRLPG